MNEEACSLGWIAVALSIIMLFQTEICSLALQFFRCRSSSSPETGRQPCSSAAKRVTLIDTESKASTDQENSAREADSKPQSESLSIPESLPIPVVNVKTSRTDRLPDLCCSLTTQASEISINDIVELVKDTPIGQERHVEKTVDVSHIFFSKSTSRRSDRIDPKRAIEIAQRVGRNSFRQLEDGGSIHSFGSKLQGEREPRRRVTRRASCTGCYTPALRDSIYKTPCLSSRARLGRQNSQGSLLSEDSFVVAAKVDDDLYFRKQDSQRSLWSEDSGIPAIQLVPARTRLERRGSVEGGRGAARSSAAVDDDPSRTRSVLPVTIRPLARRGSMLSQASQGSLGYGWCPSEKHDAKPDPPPHNVPLKENPPRPRPGRRASISEGMAPSPRRSSIHGGRGSGATLYEFLPQTIYVG